MGIGIIHPVRILPFLLVSLILSSHRGIAAEAEPPPDEVTVRGSTLTGWILELETDGIQLRTVYGKGEISVRYEEIEHIRTQVDEDA